LYSFDPRYTVADFRDLVGNTHFLPNFSWKFGLLSGGDSFSLFFFAFPILPALSCAGFLYLPS